MSVKGDRRAWYAANVEDKPAGEPVGSDAYMAWVARANEHMRRICVPGSAELLDNVASIAPVAPVASVLRRASIAAPAKDDRAAFREFCDQQFRAFGEYTDAPGGWSDDLFDSGKIARSGRPVEAFKGSLKSVRPYLNGDAKLALDNGIIRWVTFTEFRAERAELRATEAQADEDARIAYESGDCVMCLASVCECVEIEWAA